MGVSQKASFTNKDSKNQKLKF